MISILLVDDYTIVRRGVRALLETAPDMVIVGEAADGETAVLLVSNLKPDVVLLDLVMPGLGGIETLTSIKENVPQTQVLVLTNFSEEQQVLAALQAGANGYLLKEAVSTDLLSAIRDVVQGKLVLHPTLILT